MTDETIKILENIKTEIIRYKFRKNRYIVNSDDVCCIPETDILKIIDDADNETKAQ